MAPTPQQLADRLAATSKVVKAVLTEEMVRSGGKQRATARPSRSPICKQSPSGRAAALRVAAARGVSACGASQRLRVPIHKGPVTRRRAAAKQQERSRQVVRRAWGSKVREVEGCEYMALSTKGARPAACRLRSPSLLTAP